MSDTSQVKRELERSGLELVEVAVAGSVGMELLAHLEADHIRPDALFDVAERVARLLDTLRRAAG